MTTLCVADLKRVSSQGGKPTGVRGATAVRPNFYPELVSIDPKSNEQRFAEWRERLNYKVEAA